MRMTTLHDYLGEAYDIAKLKEKVACDNCGSKDDLISDPDTDGFVCEYCAKNSYMNDDLGDVIWCEVKRES